MESFRDHSNGKFSEDMVKKLEVDVYISLANREKISMTGKGD